MQKRIVWKELVTSHPELTHFPLTLLAHHLALILHVPLTLQKVKNLKRRGVILWSGLLPKVATGLSAIGNAIFAEMYAALFERQIDCGTWSAKDCTSKKHKHCVAVTFTKCGKKKVTHVSEEEARKRFYVSEELQNHMESRVDRFNMVTGKTEKSFHIAKGERVASKRTYLYKEVQGKKIVSGIVRKSLYKLHSSMYNAIEVRRFWNGLKTPIPIFSIADVEQTVCEYLYLAMQGVGDNAELNKRVAAVVGTKKGKQRDNAIADLGTFLCGVARNVYLSMLHKETHKLSRYDNLTDFAEQIDGVCTPLALHAADVTE